MMSTLRLWVPELSFKKRMRSRRLANQRVERRTIALSRVKPVYIADVIPWLDVCFGC